MKKELNFTEGKIMAPLFGFALPVLLALFLQAMYGAVDLMIVGQFGTPQDVSAVSTGSMIMQTATMVITGLAMGTTVLLGQKIGQRDEEGAGRTVGASICLFVLLGLMMTVLMLLAARPIAVVMQAPEKAFDLTVLYIRICSGGALFIVSYNVLGSIFRGMGNSRVPLVTVTIACISNIIGDLVFVAGMHMGVAGAALATVLAQAISVALSLWIIGRSSLPFPFFREYIRFDGTTIRSILKLGIPISLQDLLVSISFLVILSIVNSLGVIVSAGVGVAEKICAFIMLVPSAFMQYMSTFTAQNTGAGKPERAKKALVYSIGASLCIGVPVGLLCYFRGDVLSLIFAKDVQVVTAAADYLRAYAIDCVLVCFLFCLIGYFSGSGKTTFVMCQGIAGAFGVRIPVSYVMSHLQEISLFKIGLATPVSTMVQIILCSLFYLYLHLQLRNRKDDMLL